jgi:lipoprotein-anchoring transpeptidase ErfK/SrfK
MEVLVSRPTHRISRPLILVLALIVSLVALSVIYKVRRTQIAAPVAPIAPTANLPLPGSIGPSVADAPASRPAGPAEPTSSSVLLASALEPPTTLPSSPLTILSDAKAKMDAGNLLSARTQLNDTLQSGQLDPSDDAAIKAMIQQISQTVVFGREHFPDDPWGGTCTVESGDSLARIAAAHDTTWELLSRINGIDPKHLRAGATIKVVEGPFFGVVDKQKFTLDLYLGGLPGEKSSMYVTSFSVGLGRDQSTPAGTWMVEPHHKLRHPTYYSPRGEGVIAADDPKNPLGGYWIGLTGTDGQALGKMSYGIHGTIDPSSIGKQSSMGCIRLRSEDIALVYDLMVEGKSMVVVKD